jgi:DNA-binding response OmpR family regulator
MRVLIIDTSRSIRESLLELLSSNDHKAEEASGSEDAIVSLRSFYPEVILLGSSVKGIQKILEAVNAEMIRLMKRPKIFMMVKKDTDVPLNVTPDGLIRKPFGSAEILDLLSANKEEEKEKRSLF